MQPLDHIIAQVEMASGEAGPEAIFERATAAAEEAVAACGPEDTSSFNCGFAWVVITPARGKLVSFLKKRGIGNKHHKGGWQIWNPGKFRGQQVDHQYAGARAFANVLGLYGIRADAGSRLD